MEHEAHGGERNTRIGTEELVEAERLRGRDVPLPVGLVHVQSDLRRGVHQVHEATVVRPVDEVQTAGLSVERVERDVELAGGREFPSRHPLHGAVEVDARAELLVGLVVVDRLGTAAEEYILVNHDGVGVIHTSVQSGSRCKSHNNIVWIIE